MRCKKIFKTEAHDVIFPIVGKIRSIDGKIVCSNCDNGEAKTMKEQSIQASEQIKETPAPASV